MDESNNIRRLSLILLACAVISKYAEKNERKRRRRNTWVKPWIQRRDEKGLYNNLIQEMKMEDRYDYKKYFRMTPECFKVSSFLIFVGIVRINITQSARSRGPQ